MPADTFSGLAGPAVAEAIQARAATRRFARGEALMHAGQPARDVLVLRSGWAKVSSTTPAGRQVLLAFRGPGDLIGELSALDDRPRSATIVALGDVEAAAMSHRAFLALLAELPGAWQALLKVLSGRLRDADAKRVQLAAYTTLGRVAFCLLELGERFAADDGVDVLLGLSQEELASWAGTSLESVGRSLATMRRLGWIETRRRGFRVLDRDALVRATA
jgi:CRP/FNR family transcriptional regulator, cyclic AMP receptor protein